MVKINSSKLADSNIPQGRGMIKWMPFATMPEQFENVSNLIEAQLQQELELKLRELQGCNVILRYWSDSYEHQVECTIEHVDDWSEIVTTVKEGSMITVELKHVYSVDEYDYLDMM